MPVLYTISSAPSLSDAFGSALSAIQTQAMGYIGQALPVGLAIAGTIIAIMIGVKVVKRVTK